MQEQSNGLGAAAASGNLRDDDDGAADVVDPSGTQPKRRKDAQATVTDDATPKLLTDTSLDVALAADANLSEGDSQQEKMVHPTATASGDSKIDVEIAELAVLVKALEIDMQQLKDDQQWLMERIKRLEKGFELWFGYSADGGQEREVESVGHMPCTDCW